jgi:hypothetical protein
MGLGVLFIVLLSLGLSWGQNPPTMLVVVRASDDSLWKMTCDEVGCSAFTSFPGMFRYQPTVTWDETAQEWVIVGTASNNSIWTATFNKNGSFNNDWQAIPGATPSPSGASGSYYGVVGKLNCTIGQVVKWSGSAWVCASDDVGAGLTPSSTVGDVDGTSSPGSSATYSRGDHKHGISNNSITSGMIADGTIVNADISGSAAIDFTKLSGVAAAVHNHDATYVNEGQANSITTSMISNGTILFEDIGHNGCGTGQIMKWNGTAWGCGDDMTGNLILPYSGATSGAATAFSVTQSGSGSGIAAESNGVIGIRGQSNAPNGAGIAGYGTATGSVGVFGQGQNKAIYGSVNQPGAWAGYFTGNVYASGDVGFGTEIPQGKVHISSPSSYFGMVKVQNSNPGYNEATIAFVEGSDATGGQYWIAGVGGWGNTNDFVIGRATAQLVITPQGNMGLGTTSPSQKLTVRGNIAVQSATTGATVIELGEGLDYAEGFHVSSRTNVGPGSVLVIDPEHPGKLKLSEGSYDTRVAGIVAGGKGLSSAVRLGAGQFDYDVALAGRVYCNVDGTYGKVSPGDLLTTSPTPGYAMVVKDPMRAQGAILGKAMEKLEEGRRGEILVLVTLQ